MKKDSSKKIQEKVEELLSLLGTKAKATVKEEEDVVNVDIETAEEAGLLIGRHGDTLNAVQTIIGMIYRQENGEWKRISVNGSDPRPNRKPFAGHISQIVIRCTGYIPEPQNLYN